jgi:hypothetical protein
MKEAQGKSLGSSCWGSMQQTHNKMAGLSFVVEAGPWSLRIYATMQWEDMKLEKQG